MAMSQSHVLFASQLETWALMQASNQSVSSEFHAGLLNSALRIDVQRALDIVSLLDADLPTLSRFYTIDVPDVDIDIPDASKISAGLSDIAAQTEAKLAAQREQWERQDAQREAQWEATRAANKQERERRSAERKAQWEATAAANREERERKSSERKAQSERRKAEIEQRMRETLDRAKAGLDQEDESTE